MSFTPALMFQGTSSNAGKSLMTAAFCRILRDEGIKTAPFKAQNMSLNSYVTIEGGEIGRAQALQAMAARVEPHVLMNPILLKPTDDQGSQVILRGQPMGRLQARQYYDEKNNWRREVHTAYDELAADYDAIVLEGAGSPGEVNLKKHDLVNMSMASHAGAPVILVGDIHRGGVYASFIGHVAVMEEWERELLKGFLVNKFRGDATLLDQAHDYVRNFTGKPVLGVMPWVKNHLLPEEDEVNFEERYGGVNGTMASQDDSLVTIGIVELPRISNSTDIDPFLGEPDLRLVRLNSPEDLAKYRPHAVIIPGSKNVMGDLDYIRKTGLADALIQAVWAEEIHLFGICGGFQMLGQSITDPKGVETTPGCTRPGLGLFSMTTVLESEKILRQTSTKLADDGSPVLGYEIHHGTSEYDEKELFDDAGLGCRRGRIWGTYLHGIFENDGIRRGFLNALGQDAGFTGGGPKSPQMSVDEALDKFADVFRRSVDYRYLMKLMGL